MKILILTFLHLRNCAQQNDQGKKLDKNTEKFNLSDKDFVSSSPSFNVKANPFIPRNSQFINTIDNSSQEILYEIPQTLPSIASLPEYSTLNPKAEDFTPNSEFLSKSTRQSQNQSLNHLPDATHFSRAKTKSRKRGKKSSKKAHLQENFSTKTVVNPDSVSHESDQKNYPKGAASAQSNTKKTQVQNNEDASLNQIGKLLKSEKNFILKSNENQEKQYEDENFPPLISNKQSFKKSTDQSAEIWRQLNKMEQLQIDTSNSANASYKLIEKEPSANAHKNSKLETASASKSHHSDDSTIDLYLDTITSSASKSHDSSDSTIDLYSDAIKPDSSNSEHELKIKEQNESKKLAEFSQLSSKSASTEPENQENSVHTLISSKEICNKLERDVRPKTKSTKSSKSEDCKLITSEIQLSNFNVSCDIFITLLDCLFSVHSFRQLIEDYKIVILSYKNLDFLHNISKSNIFLFQEAAKLFFTGAYSHEKWIDKSNPIQKAHRMILIVLQNLNLELVFPTYTDEMINYPQFPFGLDHRLLDYSNISDFVDRNKKPPIQPISCIVENQSDSYETFFLPENLHPQGYFEMKTRILESFYLYKKKEIFVCNKAIILKIDPEFSQNAQKWILSEKNLLNGMVHPFLGKLKIRAALFHSNEFSSSFHSLTQIGNSWYLTSMNRKFNRKWFDRLDKSDFTLLYVFFEIDS